MNVAFTGSDVLSRDASITESIEAQHRSDAGPPLRILHVLRAPLGGLFRHVVDLTRAQVARGHQVGLITDSTTGGANGERTLAALAPTLALGLTRIPMHRMPHPSDLVVLGHVMRRIHATKPDVVHGHGSKGGVYARISAFLPGGSPAVRGYTPHGGSFNHRPGTGAYRIYMAIEKLLTLRTDVLLFESAYIASRFDAAVGTSSTLRRIVQNGIGPAEFVPVTPNPDAAEFVYVGELRAAKGIDTLLTALARVGAARNSKPRLVLVGSGPSIEELRGQVQALGLQGQVSFNGPMPARSAFALGRILVVPSRAESLPYIVLEAAGAHIPLVSTNVGGIPEIFGPYQDRLIPRDDVDALVTAMQAALDSSPAEAAASAEELARFVESRFSIAGMSSAVIDAYRAALARRDAKRINSAVRVLR